MARTHNTYNYGYHNKIQESLDKDAYFGNQNANYPGVTVSGLPSGILIFISVLFLYKQVSTLKKPLNQITKVKKENILLWGNTLICLNFIGPFTILVIGAGFIKRIINEYNEYNSKI